MSKGDTMHRRLLVVGVAAALIALFPAPVGATSEQFSGAVDASGDRRDGWFFTVTETGLISASLDWDDPEADLSLFLKDPSGNIQASSASSSKPESLSHNATVTGQWKLEVKAVAGAANYTLDVDHSVPAPVGATSEQFSGAVDASGDRRDGWFFTVTETGLISASLDWDDPEADLSLFLKDPSGNIQASSASSSKPESLSHNATVTGQWKLEVKAVAGAANYTLDVDLSESSPGGGPYQFTGHAGPWTAHQFQVTEPATIDVTLDWADAAASLNLYLKDPSGTIVAKSTTKGEKPKTLSHFTSEVGTWKVATKAKVGSSDYTIDVALTGGSPPTVDVPVYVRTVGGPGAAEMYPSGLDVGPTGRVFVADTGNDQIKAYATDGSLLWVTGDHGPKKMGRFDNPRDVAHHDGKVYVADTGYKRVQVLDADDGTPLEVWSVTIKSPMGVTAGVDALGNDVILVAQGADSRIEVYNPSGVLQRIVGSEGSGDGQFIRARDAATDSDGNIYVVDYGNHRVVKFDPDGTWLMNWGSLGTEIGQFKRPYGIAVDADDFLYIADNNNERIHKYDTVGNFLDEWGEPGMGTGQFHRLRRVAVGAGSDPDVYGAALWGYKVEQFAQDGTHERTFGGSPPPAGGFNEPYGVSPEVVATFVMDTTNQRGQRFSPTGSFELTWGSRGDDADDLLGFDWPRDITVDTADRVWVSDTKNNRIAQYDLNGVPTGVVFGVRGRALGEFNRPFALDALGTDVVIADTKNDRVQRWDTTGGPVAVVRWSAHGIVKEPKDVAVFGSSVFVADSNNRRVVELDAADGSFVREFGAAELHTVEGVAVEPNGDVWVADTSKNRLVEYDANGVFIQEYGSLGSGHGQFNRPAHLEVLVESNTVYLFVADVWNDRIEVFEVGTTP